MHNNEFIHRDRFQFYGGAWQASEKCNRYDVINPSTGERFASVEYASRGDISAAVTTAVSAFAQWKASSGESRAHFLQAFANGLKHRQESLCELQMLNNGKPKHEALVDIEDAIAAFEYYADLAIKLDNQQGADVDLADADYSGRTYFEPIGPVGLIVPWNFPLVTSAWKIAPALAAGCTVTMKVSEVTPLIELVYADIAEACQLPPGVLNILTGDAQAGAALVADNRLRKISFTGSNSVGAKIMSSVSQRTLPVSLELGGKSPIVVLKDADIELAIECIVSGVFYNCGQMCSATSRLIVAQEIAETVIAGVITKIKSLKIGSPFAETSVDMGPLTNKAQYDQVLRFQQKAKESQLQCLAGGDDSAYEGGGFFVSPTIYDHVPRTHDIWRKEIFGPVLAIQRFQTIEQAIELANDSEYGLVATILSQDTQAANELGRQIDVGHVWVNAPQLIFPNTTWGGFKASGIGRELGPWGMAAYQGVKHMTSLKR